MFRLLHIALLIALAFSAFSCSTPADTISSSPSTYLHTRPAWTSDGRSISFANTATGSGGIWAIDSNGQNLRLLHGAPTGDVSSSWSPDAKRITFSLGGQIFIKIIGTDTLLTVSATANSMRPTWSPDGRSIAYIQRYPSSPSSVWVKNLAGGTEQMVEWAGDYVAWFPGTRRLLVGQITVAGDGSYGYILRSDAADSSSGVDLATIRTFDNCGFFVPSIDGKKVYFSRISDNAIAQIWSLDLTTYKTAQITTDGGDYPAVSPDGSRIVYTRPVFNDGCLWIMNIDGTGKHRLTSP